MTYVRSAGMVCAVGLRADASCAAIRAGIAGFRRTKFLDEGRRFIVGAAVPPPAPPSGTVDRLIAILSVSLRECLKNQEFSNWEQVPLLVGVAEPDRPTIEPGAGNDVLTGVQQALGISFHPGLSRLVSQGHTAGFDALYTARHYLQNNNVPACVVGGVDSYLNTEALCWLERHSRLKTPENSDGVIPGEAAAAVLVCREPANANTLATEIVGIGRASEPASILTEEPMLGMGLTEAARTALAEARTQMHEVDFRIADVTGESYGFKEQALLVGRLLKSPKQKLPLWDCAGSIGDVGAAAGICQLVVAHYAFQKGYAPGETALCCTSAVPGNRAVAVVRSRIA